MAEDTDALFNDEPAIEAPEPVDVPIQQEINEQRDAALEQLAPAEQVEQPEAQPEPTPPVQQRPDAGFVPIGAVLDEREKRKDLERRLAEYERQNAPQQAPDPFDDPAGYAAHTEQKVEQRLTQERFAMSDMFARQQHGAETVDGAVAWAQERAQADPAFAMSYMRQQNPINWIVQQHKRDALLSDIGDNPDDWFTREAAKRGYVSQTVTPAAVVQTATPYQAPAPAKVPRSLATQGSGPSDIRDVATGALAAVDAVFPN